MTEPEKKKYLVNNSELVNRELLTTERQRFSVDALHPPRHPVASVMLRSPTKDTLCICCISVRLCLSPLVSYADGDFT
jgi:hypothetical protein